MCSETLFIHCVQKSYHSFSDNDINYKPSMKNIQSFRVIRFLTKIKFVPRGHFTPPMGQNTPQSDKAICFKHLQQNQSTGSFSLKLKKKNIINNYELQNYNSLF